LSNKLLGIGCPMDDEWQAAIILAGLNEEYRPFIMGLEASGAKMDPDEISAKLIDSAKEQSTGNALYAKSGGKKRIPKCYNCKKKGHVKRDCKEKPSTTIANGNAKAAFLNVVKTNDENANTALMSKKYCINEWFVDSGASNHMTPYENILSKQKRLPGNEKIMSASSDSLTIKSVGSTTLRTGDDEISIESVLHVPGLTANLLSVSRIVEKGNSILFDKKGCTIRNERNEVVTVITPEHGVYKIKSNDQMCLFTHRDNIMSWHRKLGHANSAYTKNFLKANNIAVKDDPTEVNAIKNCVVCSRGKSSRKPFELSNTMTSEVLELIHSDLAGPMEEPSLGGARYILTFIDDFSNKVFVYFLKAKSEVFDKFKEFKNLIENQTNRKIKKLRTDNGTEYTSKDFENACKKAGIVHQLSCPYTPQQNGTAERMNRTLVEKARCLLLDAGLPKSYWAEATNMSAFILNNLPRSEKSPDELFYKKKLELPRLELFGASVMVHIPKQKRKKWDPKADNLIFVGYDPNTKGFRCADKYGKIIISRDVKFLQADSPELIQLDEERAPGIPVKEVQTKIEFPWEVKPDVQEAVLETVDNATNATSVNGTGNGDGDTTDEPQASESQYLTGDEDSIQDQGDPDYEPEITIVPDEPARTTRATTRAANPFSFNNWGLFTTPMSVKSALNEPDAAKWQLAMDEEIKSHQQNSTWKLDELPPGRKAIKAKWVFRRKMDEAGNVCRFKARLVAKGYSQRYGLDYTETFSPVVRYASVRLLMAIAVSKRMKIHQMDVITAYLQSDLEEKIFMEQPENYQDGTKRVCRLMKSIYGLKQSGLNWNTRLDSELTRYGLFKSKLDPCVYFDKSRDLMMAIYVDDFLIFYKTNEDIKKLRTHLLEKFKMKDLGPARSCLGIRINVLDNRIELDQSSYIQEVLLRFGMADCKAVGTPSDTSEKLSNTVEKDTKDLTGKVPYQEAVGSILYLAQCTRPDVAFATNNVSRFNGKHSEKHWMAVKRILRYLRGTIDRKLVFSNSQANILRVYCDSDWASEQDERKSCTGFVATLSGGAVSWCSKRQPIVALSSTEAEYIALSSAVGDAIWIKQLMQELGTPPKVIILCDNQSAIKLAKSDAFRPRTKHIDVRYHYIRNYVTDGSIKIEHVSTNLMAADSLTKSVSKEKTQLCAKLMGLA